VYSALYFVLTVFATAGLFVLLWAEFMAAALVLIYAGAILVTYVFVIMLAAEAAPASTTGTGAGDGDGDGDAPGGTGALSTLSETDAISREPLAACAVGFALLGVLLFVIFDKAQAVTRDPAPAAAQVDANGPHLEGVQLLGDFLFRRHLLNLELAGLMLTVSMVGAIVIARKRVVGESGPLADAGISAAGAAGVADVETITGPATPVNDDPHSIPVYGTRNPRQKEYPET